MDITTDCDGTTDGLNVGFAKEDSACFVTETLDIVLGELLALAEMRNPRVLLGDIDHVSKPEQEEQA